jgi:hypothetical protein
MTSFIAPYIEHNWRSSPTLRATTINRPFPFNPCLADSQDKVSHFPKKPLAPVMSKLELTTSLRSEGTLSVIARKSAVKTLDLVGPKLLFTNDHV